MSRSVLLFASAIWVSRESKDGAWGECGRMKNSLWKLRLSVCEDCYEPITIVCRPLLRLALRIRLFFLWLSTFSFLSLSVFHSLASLYVIIFPIKWKTIRTQKTGRGKEKSRIFGTVEHVKTVIRQRACEYCCPSKRATKSLSTNKRQDREVLLERYSTK